jgi:hypothetical protein
MSLITSHNNALPRDAAAPQGFVAPQSFVAPRKPLSQRINFRMVLLALVVMLPVGGFVYQWAVQALSGGIINRGLYDEVNLKAMSSFDMDQSSGQMSDVPPRFLGLENKRVLLVGEMWAPRDAGDGSLSYFQLVYSKTKCCFNGPPLAQHFVDSNVNPGKTVYYDSDGMVRVWGTLHVKFRREGPVIKSVYEVDVDKVEPM